MEALQKMSDPKLKDCPECSQPGLQKQVTAAAFKLKGTGWYETDFKNSGKKPEPAKSAGGKPDSVKNAPSEKANGDSGSNTSTATPAAGD